MFSPSERNASRGRGQVVDGRVEYVLGACAGKRVLHLGCADDPYTQQKLVDGTLLHGRVAEVADALYGLDSSSAGIAILRTAGFTNIAVGDVEKLVAPPALFPGAEFDVLLAGEIIEHLSNPGLFLEGVKPYLSAASILLVTTVNAYCAHRFLHSLLTGRESVNPDHTMYFSRVTLTRLAEAHGYKVDDLRFHPAKEYEQHLNQGRYRLLWWSDRFAARYRPELSDGIVARLSLNPTFSPSRAQRRTQRSS